MQHRRCAENRYWFGIHLLAIFAFLNDFNLEITWQVTVICEMQDNPVGAKVSSRLSKGSSVFETFPYELLYSTMDNMM